MRERKERNDTELLTRTYEQAAWAKANAQESANKQSDKTVQGEEAHVEEDKDAMLVEDDVQDEAGEGSGTNRRDRGSVGSNVETVGQPSPKRARRDAKVQKAPERLNL